MVEPESMRGRELEEYLSLLVSLREHEKEMRWSFIFLLMCGPVGLRKETQESFLDVLLTLKKLVELVHCMAGQVLVFRV